MCGPAGSWPRPFAVGVLALAGAHDAASRAAARLDVALDAYKYGYFLIDIIDIAATSGDAAGYAIAEQLVARTSADALIASGPVDGERLAGIADRNRLVVRRGEQGPR
jgi:hypothetical protein